jgi:hypothetical protein
MPEVYSEDTQKSLYEGHIPAFFNDRTKTLYQFRQEILFPDGTEY